MDQLLAGTDTVHLPFNVCNTPVKVDRRNVEMVDSTEKVS